MFVSECVYCLVEHALQSDLVYHSASHECPQASQKARAPTLSHRLIAFDHPLTSAAVASAGAWRSAEPCCRLDKPHVTYSFVVHLSTTCADHRQQRLPSQTRLGQGLLRPQSDLLLAFDIGIIEVRTYSLDTYTESTDSFACLTPEQLPTWLRC